MLRPILKSVFQLAACTATLACGPGLSPETETASDRSGNDASPSPLQVIEGNSSSTDPVRVSPDRYRVLEAAPEVRMLAAEWPAGAADKPHSHPTTIWYALTDANLQIETGSPPLSTVPLTRSISAGTTGVQGPVALHSVRNTGEDTASILMFEIQPQPAASNEAQTPAAPRAIAVGNHFRLLEEHEGFRLILASIEPNRRDRLHSHPPTVWFALDRSSLRFSEPASEPVEFIFEAGEVGSQPATTGHTVTNLGDAPARFLLLEAGGI